VATKNHLDMRGDAAFAKVAHGNAWSACRSECLVITKVGRLIFAADRDIGVILFPE
jgi:hypothetical protein